MNAYTFRLRAGALLIEVIIGLMLCILFGVAIMQMSFGTFGSVHQSRDQLVAINYAHEALESVRTMARQNFDDIVDGTHGIINENKKFLFSGTSTTWGKYTMYVVIEPTYRDVHGALIMPNSPDLAAILAAGGAEEFQAKLVTAHVEWIASAQPKSVAAQSLVTKWFHYPLQSKSATGTLAGIEYEFSPMEGGPYTHWNAIYWNAAAGIDYVQMRAADSYGTLLTRSWVGPDGTNGSTYVDNPSSLHNDSAGSGTWIQGKAWLNGSGTESPILTILFE